MYMLYTVIVLYISCYVNYFVAVEQNHWGKGNSTTCSPLPIL